MRTTIHDFGPGFPKVTIGITRVRWYSQLVLDVRFAVRDLRRAVWGCGWFRRHRWATRHYIGVAIPGAKPGEHGRWAMNICRECGYEHLWASRH